MHQRAALDLLDVVRGETEVQGQPLAVERDALGMAGRVRIAQIDRVGQRRQRLDERRLRLAPAPLEFARCTGRKRDQRARNQRDDRDRRNDHLPALAFELRAELRGEKVDREHVLTPVLRRERLIDGAHAVALGIAEPFARGRAGDRRIPRDAARIHRRTVDAVRAQLRDVLVQHRAALGIAERGVGRRIERLVL